MKTTKTISAITFAAAFCCASPVFAGRHAGAGRGMEGAAGVRSGSTEDASFGQSNAGRNDFITEPLPRTGTDISRERERGRSRTDGNMSERERERERELPNGTVEEQRQEQRTNAAGQTQTRSQERTLAPNQ